MSKFKAKTFVVKSFESILVIGYILFEELIWNVFAKPIYLYFKSLTVLDALKSTFLAMNRYMLLCVFLVIFAIAEAMGFISGFYFINGDLAFGILVYALKIPIAAFTFWLFDLTKNKLLSFAWLKKVYLYIEGLIHKFISSSLHVYIKSQITRLRIKMKALVVAYFGEGGIVASIKSHYFIFKPFLTGLLRK